MATFRDADQTVHELITELMQAHHHPLFDAGVRVGCLFAYAPTNPVSGEPKGPALKHHGYPAAALVKIVSHKDRVAGLPDAMILVDGEKYEQEWDDQRRRAVLDHELEHLELQLDEEEHIKLDDSHRPKLKIRPHDWEAGGFETIASRYKDAALDVSTMQEIRQRHGHLLFKS